MTEPPSKKDWLTYRFENMQAAEPGRRHYEAKSALSSALYDLRLKGQIAITATPTFCGWGEYSNERVRANVKNSFHSKDDGLTSIKLVGGVVLDTLNNNFVWVVAAKPSQLKDDSDKTLFRAWGVSYDDIQYLASIDPRQEVEVVEEVKVTPLTAVERFNRIVDSNIFIYGNPFGPSGRSAPGFGAPC